MLFHFTVGFKINSNVTITTSYMYNVYGHKLQPWRELQAICLTHGQHGFGFLHFPEHIISRFLS